MLLANVVDTGRRLGRLRKRDNGTGESQRAVETWLRLRTAEALHDDIGTNRVRLCETSRRRFGVRAGDIVEVRTYSSLWSRVAEAPSHDDGLGLARLDPALLREIGVATGEWVFVRKGTSSPARLITLRRIHRDEGRDSGSWNFLEGHTLIVGDVVRVGAETDKRAEEAHVSLAGLRLVTVDIRRARFEAATVRVDHTDPEGPVVVGSATIIDLLPEDVKGPSAT